jgi:transcriptional regulator with XRE-family HTH domain
MHGIYSVCYSGGMDVQLNDRVVANLIHAIDEMHLPKGEVAEAAGITRVQLSRILHANSRTTVDTCESLANAIGLPADSLFMEPIRFKNLVKEILSAVA